MASEQSKQISQIARKYLTIIQQEFGSDTKHILQEMIKMNEIESIDIITQSPPPPPSSPQINPQKIEKQPHTFKPVQPKYDKAHPHLFK